MPPLRCRVRDLAALRTTGYSYRQRGVVATVRTVEPNHTAWQRFLGTGPLALLPVRGGASNIVWSTSPAQARPELIGLTHIQSRKWIHLLELYTNIHRTRAFLEGRFIQGFWCLPPTLSGPPVQSDRMRWATWDS